MGTIHEDVIAYKRAAVKLAEKTTALTVQIATYGTVDVNNVLSTYDYSIKDANSALAGNGLNYAGSGDASYVPQVDGSSTLQVELAGSWICQGAYPGLCVAGSSIPLFDRIGHPFVAT
jgi:hypothetical protein